MWSIWWSTYSFAILFMTKAVCCKIRLQTLTVKISVKSIVNPLNVRNKPIIKREFTNLINGTIKYVTKHKFAKLKF